MKIRDIMETKVITVTAQATYLSVAKLLYEHNISGVPVVEVGGEVVGMVSEKDLYRILYPYYKSYYEHPENYTDLEARENKAKDIQNTRVETFMTKNHILIVKPDDPIMKAGALMLAHNISRLPVLENGKLVGIVSRKMIYRAILKKNFGL